MASIFKVGDRWRAQIRRAGLKPLSEYFPTKAEAQRWAREHEVKIDKGERTVKAAPLTFAAVADAFIEKGGNLSDRQVYNVTGLKNQIGDWRLDKPIAKQVMAFIATKEREGCAPSSIGNYIYTIRGAIRKGAMLEDKLPQVRTALQEIREVTAMMRELGRVTDSVERDRRPEPEELEAIIQSFETAPSEVRSSLAAFNHMTDIILFAVATTMRRGEILRIKRSDLDVKRRMIWIRDRKHPKKKRGNHKNVPLLAGPFVFRGQVVDPFEIIQRQPVSKANPDIIFPFKGDDVSKRFAEVADALQIDDLRFHDLRHDGISRLFEFGYPIEQVALVSGHEDWKALKRYTNLKPVDLHKKAAQPAGVSPETLQMFQDWLKVNGGGMAGMQANSNT